MEIIQHNKQITKGSILVCVRDTSFGIKADSCLKVKEAKGTDKVQFVVPDRTLYLEIDGYCRFRKAYKNEEKLCVTSAI